MKEPISGIEMVPDKLAVAILIIGRDDGLFHYINQCVCRDVGKSHEEILGIHFRQIFWPEFIPTYSRLAAECEDGLEHTAIYYWAEMYVWEQISARSVTWDDIPCILLSITKISEVARSEYKFESMAHFDNVLKLPNGSKLEEDLNELANVETVALLYFEMERFEDINHLYGWDNGDALLIQVRDWLLYSESRRSQLYRVNNGFAILGRGVSLEQAKERAEEILRRFDNPWVLTAGGNAVSVFCTAKLGIVYGKYVKNEMRNLLLRTIRSAKTTISRYAIYDERRDSEAKRALKLRDVLINCIYNDMKGFEVHYQPIVEARTQKWKAVEALCRWTTPDGIKVSPLEFIHVAEQLGLIDRVDEWVRRTAMLQCASLGLHEKDFVLDINFSPTQRIEEGFIKNLYATLEETRFPPEKLALEITESAKMSFDTDNIDGLKRLRAGKVKLSLDDFGTGYSSFENLIKISADSLKTERLFLEGIENDGYRQYLLNMLIDIAHYLKMHLVSEGVESEEQYMLLKQYGVDFIQGYYFSRPLSFEQLQAEVGRFR